jgi:hypothetical protein
MPRTNRQDVYVAIDSERDYQDRMTADISRPDMISDLHLGDTLSAIQHNLTLATTEWYQGSEPHPRAMNFLRKIAGLCVQAGEKHGMPYRHAPNTTKGKVIQIDSTVLVEYENYEQVYPRSGRDMQGNEKYGFVTRQRTVHPDDMPWISSIVGKEVDMSRLKPSPLFE